MLWQCYESPLARLTPALTAGLSTPLLFKEGLCMFNYRHVPEARSALSLPLSCLVIFAILNVP